MSFESKSKALELMCALKSSWASEVEPHLFSPPWHTAVDSLVESEERPILWTTAFFTYLLMSGGVLDRFRTSLTIIQKDLLSDNDVWTFRNGRRVCGGDFRTCVSKSPLSINGQLLSISRYYVEHFVYVEACGCSCSLWCCRYESYHCQCSSGMR